MMEPLTTVQGVTCLVQPMARLSAHSFDEIKTTEALQLCAASHCEHTCSAQQDM